MTKVPYWQKGTESNCRAGWREWKTKFKDTANRTLLMHWGPINKYAQSEVKWESKYFRKINTESTGFGSAIAEVRNFRLISLGWLSL